MDKTWWYRYRDERVKQRFLDGQSIEDIGFAMALVPSSVKKILKEQLKGHPKLDSILEKHGMRKEIRRNEVWLSRSR